LEHRGDLLPDAADVVSWWWYSSKSMMWPLTLVIKASSLLRMTTMAFGDLQALRLHCLAPVDDVSVLREKRMKYMMRNFKN
jgi:hypothetical protein